MAVFGVLRNLKIRYKFLLVFGIMFLLMLDLGALNITSVSDIQADTERISEQLIPRLIQTSSIKDNLNAAILDAYDYVQTGNQQSKIMYGENLKNAINAQVELFYLSTSEADFEFTTSFQDHINGINSDLENLIVAFELGGTSQEIQENLDKVATSRDGFTQFLEDEVELKVQEESLAERERTATQVQQTTINVGIVGIIAFVVLVLLFAFIRGSITVPVQKLTKVADSIGKGTFSTVEIKSRDELGLFAQTFNTMTTRIKSTQDALVVELEKTKKLDRQKTEFLSIAAHQLRTPMSGIKWVVSMAAEGDLGKMPEEAAEQLGKSLENIDRMINLINSLLDVTQIEAKGLEIEPVGVDIDVLVKEVVESIQPLSDEMGVKVGIKKPDKKLHQVLADTERIGMAFRNLIDNAIRYTPKDGKVLVSFQAKKSSIAISVSDSGYGIPELEQERIFSKFYRGTNIQTIQADGSGLGLFVVGEIVKSHKGKISFVSKEGKGTTFTIELPIYTKKAADAFAKAAAARAKEDENLSRSGLG